MSAKKPAAKRVRRKPRGVTRPLAWKSVAELEAVEKLERTREDLRTDARNRLGVTGSDEKAPPLLQVLRERQVSAYPLIALGVLSIVDTFQGYAFRVLAPDLSASLGISKGAVAGLLALSTLAGALGPLPVAALTAQKARRALIIIITGVLWSLVALSTGFVTATAGLALVLVLDGLTTASVSTLHTPVLLDTYPPEGRVRALSYYIAFNNAGNVAAPLLVALFTTALAFTWRGAFVALGVISLAATMTAVRLRDPGFGRWDTEQIRAAVREKETGKEQLAEVGLEESDVTLGFFEIVRRLTLIPTVRRLLAVEIAFGIFVIPYQTFLAFFLDERWNLGPGARGVFTAFLAGVSIVALAVYGSRGEALFRRNPARVVDLGAWLIAIAVVFICLAALAPNFALVVTCFGIASALLAALAPSLSIALLSVIPSGMRPHASALIGIAVAVGGLAGALLLGSVDSQYGIVGTIVSLAVPGIIGSLILRTTAPLVPVDLDRMIDETLEDEEIRQITSEGGRLPMLACRKIDFSYGHVQVLFGVDFTVDDGEMVALLGTNGAGKSTLLKVVSGIGLPTAGSVRYRGADITYLDAERRLRLGITQIPGGRAVFGPMNVVENLRVFGYSMGRKRREVEAAIDRSFDAFPRLDERKEQKASTLSGGEQQMLGLAKALMLKPRLLLVDELSLGLAPVIVGQLLDMVREINRQGTAVVLVEQSVNIALNLVEHAYFMEKGEIRFDGPSRELLRRDDLLRAVFLGAPERSGGANGRRAGARKSR
jgi:ABC-type branched-subunit amino acid transport system ATPase component/predicted MFS family arabinose efflux permease